MRKNCRGKICKILLLINVNRQQINLEGNKTDVIFAKFYPLRVENTGARPSYDGLIIFKGMENYKIAFA